MTIELNFQKKYPGFKYLKTEKLDTLLPLSVMQKHNLSTPVLNTEIPIFYNVKQEDFCIFLPDDFLKDININELTKNTIRGTSIIKDKNSQSYLYFSYSSLIELRAGQKDEKSAFSILKRHYENHLLDIKTGELVIFIAFKNHPSSDVLSKNSLDFSENIKKAIIGTSSKFQFFKSLKFNNKYYFLDKEGNINQDLNFVLDKNSEQSMNYLVIPYTPEDWEMVNKIQEKIVNIKSKIDTLFAEQKQLGMLDKPLSQSSNLLLNDFTDTNTRKNKFK